jgi:hypothetical protein
MRTLVLVAVLGSLVSCSKPAPVVQDAPVKPMVVAVDTAPAPASAPVVAPVVEKVAPAVEAKPVAKAPEVNVAAPKKATVAKPVVKKAPAKAEVVAPKK